MTLREVLFTLMKDKQMQQAAGQALTTAWQDMTAAQHDALVQKLITNPEDAGRQLKQILVAAIETAVNTQLDTILAQTSIPVTTLQNMVS